jgi:hypothetical protein
VTQYLPDVDSIHQNLPRRTHHHGQRSSLRLGQRRSGHPSRRYAKLISEGSRVLAGLRFHLKGFYGAFRTLLNLHHRTQAQTIIKNLLQFFFRPLRRRHSLHACNCSSNIRLSSCGGSRWRIFLHFPPDNNPDRHYPLRKNIPLRHYLLQQVQRHKKSRPQTQIK